jgi:hypothetical protein
MASRRGMEQVVRSVLLMLVVWGTTTIMGNSIRQEVKALAGGSVSLRYNIYKYGFTSLRFMQRYG